MTHYGKWRKYENVWNFIRSWTNFGYSVWKSYLLVRKTSYCAGKILPHFSILRESKRKEHLSFFFFFVWLSCSSYSTWFCKWPCWCWQNLQKSWITVPESMGALNFFKDRERNNLLSRSRYCKFLMLPLLPSFHILWALYRISKNKMNWTTLRLI